MRHLLAIRESLEIIGGMKGGLKLTFKKNRSHELEDEIEFLLVPAMVLLQFLDLISLQ